MKKKLFGAAFGVEEKTGKEFTSRFVIHTMVGGCNLTAPSIACLVGFARTGRNGIGRIRKGARRPEGEPEGAEGEDLAGWEGISRVFSTSTIDDRLLPNIPFSGTELKWEDSGSSLIIRAHC